MSAIIETVPTAMCLLDESLHVVAFNTQATRQLALAPAELSGADFLEVLGWWGGARRRISRPPYPTAPSPSSGERASTPSPCRWRAPATRSMWRRLSSCPAFTSGSTTLWQRSPFQIPGHHRHLSGHGGGSAHGQDRRPERRLGFLSGESGTGKELLPSHT